MSGVFGTDEAGKGPVLGPMIAACVSAPDESALPDGIDDSKRLTATRREELSRALRADDRISVGLAAITPERIDAPRADMNTLTVVAHATAASRVVESGEGICDAGDVDAARFVRRVRERLPEEVSLAGEHGADGIHAIVGAASIVAKVERDARVRALEAEYGPVGSGYPSDPVTREFLGNYVAEHGDLPACARASWQTCADVLSAARQGTLADF